MKKYIINVHFDMVVTKEVVAATLDEAKEMAINEAASSDLNTEADCCGTDSCLVSEEEVRDCETTNLEMLFWGMNHIAQNHGFKASANEHSIAEDGEVCIFGGCNVPTLADVKFLCEDVHIPADYIESSEMGIDVFIPEDWSETTANETYKGNNYWRKN